MKKFIKISKRSFFESGFKDFETQFRSLEKQLERHGREFEIDDGMDEKIKFLDFEISRLREYIWILVIIVLIFAVIILMKEKRNIKKVAKEAHLDELKDKFNKHVKPKSNRGKK